MHNIVCTKVVFFNATPTAASVRVSPLGYSRTPTKWERMRTIEWQAWPKYRRAMTTLGYYLKPATLPA